MDSVFLLCVLFHIILMVFVLFFYRTIDFNYSDHCYQLFLFWNMLRIWNFKSPFL
jgi:hypothetical protein